MHLPDRKWVLAASLLTAGLLVPGPSRAADAPTAPKYRIHWLLGHPNIDYFEQAAASFKETVETKSKGEIEVVIETSKNPWEDQRLGVPGPEIAEAVSRGEAEMGHSFTDVMAGMEPGLHVFDAPLLFRDYKHQEQVFEGPVGKELLEGLGAHGIKGLAFTYSGGANAVFTKDHAVKVPEDLKGLRVAVFGSEVDKAWLSSLGATAVPIYHREDNAASLVDKGDIDAAILTWRRQYRAGLSQRLPYGSAEGLTYLVSVTYINQKFFQGLPAKYQDLIVKATQDAARIERQRTIELNARSLRRSVAEFKMQVAPLTKDGAERFETALAPAYKDSLERLIGKELLERVRRTGLETAFARP